jgi:HD-GYP domain-containing protein (c-di-GMP phosphodiesterase class II)
MSPFPRQLRWFTAVVFTIAVSAGLFLEHSEGFPNPGALAIFGALVVLTAQLPVRLRGGVFLSPGLMVCMAAIVVFRDDHSLLGATLVCSLVYVRPVHFSRAAWGWLPFNAGLSALAFLAAALVYGVLPSATTGSAVYSAAMVVPAALAYLAVAWTLLLLSYAVEGTSSWREVLGELLPAGAEVLPFAVLGFLLGRMYLSLGPTVMLLIIVPILISREMFASYMRVKESHDETVGMLIHALEAKDRYTSGHSERVADYARYIGEELSFMPARLERLRFAALMHDIGKLVVPNQLLNKPGRLTPEEFAQVRIHEQVSVQMLSHIDFLRPIAAASDSAHTRFDPDNPDHPIEPYIVMIADAYDAMTSTRAYRKALSQDVAFSELRDKAGIQFHPECVEALIEAVEKRGEKHGAGYEGHAEFDNAPVAGLGSAGLGDLLENEASETSKSS